MTTRPGYAWDSATNEWIQIGPVANVGSTVYYQASEPTGAGTGDLWIDADDDVPGITSTLNYRWRKIATGGETTLSGADAAGLPLAYNPGYEQLFINGVLQYRGSDYTATTGTSINGLTALVAGDVVEVLSFVTSPIGDTYTQAAADAKFATQLNFPAGQWTAYTPVLTAQSGSITSYAVNLARYIVLGKTCFVQFNINIVNNGTGATSNFITLPPGITAKHPYHFGAGREINATGNMLQVYLDTVSSIRVQTYNNGYPGGTGYNLNGSIAFEVA